MSFLRRQVMDYKEQMKQANENNAFMIHNERPGRGAFRDGGAGGDGSGKDIPQFDGRHPCGTDVSDGGGGCGASGEKRRKNVCDHRFLLPVPALCRSVRAFVCGGQGHKRGTEPCPSAIPAFMEGIPGSCLQRGILRSSARNKEDAPAVPAGPRVFLRAMGRL